MKKLVLLSLMAISFLGAAAQASSSGCPLLRKGQTLHQDGTAVPLAVSSGTTSPARGGTVPARR